MFVTCYSYDHMNAEEKEEHRENHEKHFRHKEESRRLKNHYKEVAANDETIKLLQFDLESVRYLPKLEAKSIFYKRRFAVFNLTVLDVPTMVAKNFMWHEALAKRGSSEIGSCLLQYLKEDSEKCNGPLTYHLFSDSCGGQNRNKNIVAMFLYVINILDNVAEINHTFFEPGHSLMEVDSVHAQIEKASKKIDLYDPSGWYAIVQNASKLKKYVVREMDQDNMYSMSKLRETILPNTLVDNNKNPVKFLSVREFKYKKSEPNKVYFNYTYDNQNLLYFVAKDIEINNVALQREYLAPLPISQGKYKDLQDLCNTKIIPTQYRPFYDALKPDDGDGVSISERRQKKTKEESVHRRVHC
uniref:DUF7869 domain-containing protein n=1 Tax=Cacopsylla melanoneura TaxID=428564 RepID=A0A8D8QTS6_9HEMI